MSIIHYKAEDMQYYTNINETKQKQAQQAVFMATGENTTEQYIAVMKYCKEKRLPIVNLFIEQSDDEEKLYQMMNDAMEFAAREGTNNGKRTALVFASKDNLPRFIDLLSIKKVILDDYTELHLAKSKTIFRQNRDKH